MSVPQPKIGDFLVCYNTLEKRENFRCIIIEEKSDRYETIVLLHDEWRGYKPGEKFKMPKLDWQALFGSTPVGASGTYWSIEEVESGV